GLVSGAVMLLTIPLVPIFFSEITPEATRFVQHLLALRGSTFFIKAINFTLFMGVMRSGGDTVFTMITEGLTIWTLAIPLLFVLGFWLGLPIVVVYAIVIFEELTKMTVLLLRYRSKRWMRTLTN
ncbi:MAG: hypothetical protein FWB72_07300, partial [Firmicutes bacterium]|nr:hypothetical protein [Bacillota bacterium]